MLYEYLCSNYMPNEPIFVAEIQLPDINIYTEMEKLMDITRDIPLQINWELLLKFRIWWKLYQIMPVPGYGK